METLFTCPAFVVVPAPANRQGEIVFEAGQEIAIRVGGRLVFQRFTLGSVVSSALRDGKCPIKSLDRAQRHGHRLHWANPQASVIHNGPKGEPRKISGINFGVPFKFEGRLFEFQKNGHEHVNLVPVAKFSAVREENPDDPRCPWSVSDNRGNILKYGFRSEEQAQEWAVSAEAMYG